ncbi:hypothetical protein AC578_1899 [Pseudocercospora eumusae]|uniref:Uncharacterized protein n=1 Tax=Pseudocercospora eumusae TaxID=321146 RepID=A0A139GYX3_9PEZI|nr:hypothetical protein AC578_1899 [Pseudocercospora eumusae]
MSAVSRHGCRMKLSRGREMSGYDGTSGAAAGSDPDLFCHLIGVHWKRHFALQSVLGLFLAQEIDQSICYRRDSPSPGEGINILSTKFRCDGILWHKLIPNAFRVFADLAQDHCDVAAPMRFTDLENASSASRYGHLDINAVNNNALLPVVTHLTSDLVSRFVRDQRSDHVEGAVHAGGDAGGGKDAKATQAQVGTLKDRLAARVAHLQAHASLAGRGWATTVREAIGAFLDWADAASRALAALVLLDLLSVHDVWILVFILAQVEAKVVDDVAFLDHVTAVGHVTLGRVGADDLELGDVVWVGSGSQAGKDASLSQKERSSADGHEGTLAVWIPLLEFGEGLNDAQWLALGLDWTFMVSTWNDQNVNLRQTLHGFVVVDVCAERGTLSSEHVLGGASEDDSESLGVWLLWVVQGCGEDFERSDGVHGVLRAIVSMGVWLVAAYHALMERNKNLERLEALRFFNDCTHLAGIVG